MNSVELEHPIPPIPESSSRSFLLFAVGYSLRTCSFTKYLGLHEMMLPAYQYQRRVFWLRAKELPSGIYIYPDVRVSPVGRVDLQCRPKNDHFVLGFPAGPPSSIAPHLGGHIGGGLRQKIEIFRLSLQNTAISRDLIDFTLPTTIRLQNRQQKNNSSSYSGMLTV